jgi:hypothetical protein
MLNDLGSGGARHLIAINCGLKILGDEFAAARANTTDIKLGVGLPAVTTDSFSFIMLKSFSRCPVMLQQ